MPLIDSPKNASKGKLPCGECHLTEGEACDICGAYRPTSAARLDAFVRDIASAALNLHGADARAALLKIQDRAKALVK